MVAGGWFVFFVKMCMQVFLFYVVGLCGCFFVAMWVFGVDFAVVNW